MPTREKILPPCASIFFTVASRSSTSMPKWWMQGPGPMSLASSSSSLSYTISARSMLPSVMWRETWPRSCPVLVW